ncbi:alpha-glucan family phosphorylase [Fuchsiella alkaliacetigena]|uniref:alpha-glucan family phosphorylase n=1 Tax=Fuchsiella alkaliacetigena TaxID=957042 RepID=UPI00200AFCE1|nr:alpha-glucan family phosphorylase [Fuchsiella alkaliacetigena]MCK8825575.1 alpha-glucan family phosphorylase [Fuchsiella alkaliacetigena]
MNFYGKLSINSEIPEEINGLKDLAYNLWWSWNPKAQELFTDLNLELWKEVNKNPVEFLNKISNQKLEEAATDEAFLAKYKQVMDSFKSYLADDDCWFDEDCVQTDFSEKNVIAYFSAEFGLHESLPIYSGGLGVLSGDHCKSASDLNLPFVGVGLLYHHGYFKQKINSDGWQESVYPNLDFDNLAVKPVTDEEGEELKVTIKQEHREIAIKVWKVTVGRITIYLLDTNLEENSPEDRNITSQLYGGGQQTRILQEIVLGIGGTRVLHKLNYRPVVWHMNEGHSVYLGLEKIRHFVKREGYSFEEAMERVAANTVFTTHTPVPAGNEVFPFGLKDKHFTDFWEELGLNRYEFMQLGYTNEENAEGFGLTVLALRLSRFHNGVSKLHGEVASEMWKDLWPEIPADENPITHVTNGIHTPTWLAPEIQELFDRYLPAGWKNRVQDQEVWEEVRNIPDEELWAVHKELKSKLIDHIRERDLARRKRYGNVEIMNKDLLDEDTLTIGFARRFATYKRADLIFRDLDRLAKICNQEGKEVQIIFAGKAHPADNPGQQLIKDIYDVTQMERFKDKIIIVEDYDMNLARYLVQGVDVWLNNPRRPQEASGTSGQKAAANGCLNLSVIDGWWVEGYNGKNGWAIGHELELCSKIEQDELDAESLYQTLEEEVVPMYYEHDNDLPKKWIEWMKEAMVSCGAEYSMNRMVKDYTEQLYIPAHKRCKELSEQEKVAELTNWKNKLRNKWPQLEINSPNQNDLGNFNPEDDIELTAQVNLGQLDPEDIQVELYIVPEDINGDNTDKKIIPMEDRTHIKENVYSYSTKLNLKDSGDYKYTFRVVPNDEKLTTKHELGLIKWI